MSKKCGTCHWFKNSLCNFNPRTEAKAPDDFCSNWTPKMLNEAMPGCCKGSFEE